MLVFPIFVALFFLLIITSCYRNRFYRVISAIAFFIHIIVGIVFIPRAPYGWDINQFHRAALSTLQGPLTFPSSPVPTFGTIQGFLYIFFPSQPETVSIFNGLFAVLLPIPVVYLCRQLYPSFINEQYGVMALILFLPLPFYILSLPMRDALSVLLFFTLLALSVKALQIKKVSLLCIGILFWGLLNLLRPELSFVFLLGFIAAVGFIMMKRIKIDFSLTRLIIMLGAVGFLGIDLFSEFVYDLDSANAELAYRAQGGAVYLEGMEYSSWLDLIVVAPIRALYFQFTPFPVHIEQVFHLLGFTMTPVIIILFVSAIRSLYHCNRNDSVMIFLLAVYIAGITGYGLINSNFGTNVRHRIIFDFMLVIFAAPVIKKWELQIRRWLSMIPAHSGQSNKKNDQTKQLDDHI